MQTSDHAPHDARPTPWRLATLVGAPAALVLAVALVVGEPWIGAATALVGAAAGWAVLRHRDESVWSDQGWRQLERLSPELVGQLDERAILRIALADASALLRAETTQVLLHGGPGGDAVVATQRAHGSEDVEIRDRRSDDAAASGAALVISLPGPGGEIGLLAVHGGLRRHRRTRRRLGHGLAHLVASSLAAERIYEGQRVLADDLYRSALRDDITELGNRSLLHERGSQQLARSMAQRKSAALLLIDLDDFKRVNDTLGHRVGDLLLAEVGARIGSQVRDSDLAVRLGGDEFVVLAGELASADDVELLADRLLAAIAEPMRLDGIELQLSGSLGIAVHGEDADTLEGLLVVADQAMYQAKAAGRARWRRRTRPSGRTDALLEPGQGVPEHELELLYQPQVAAAGDAVVGFEVSTRWRHPELGVLQPDDFLPELERSGLSSELAVDVLGRALADLPLLRERAPEATLSVNVSARDLLRRDLVATVRDVLAAHGRVGSDLVLEMTEPAPEPSATFAAVLSGLSELGCVVSIHEFGTAGSSLSALSSHPAITEVKLAPRLVSTALTDERALRFVRAAVEGAHGLGLRVVAEGVQSTEVALAVAELGCDRLQGPGVGEAREARAVSASPRSGLSLAR